MSRDEPRSNQFYGRLAKKLCWANAVALITRLNMAIQTCPTTIVQAPADRVWHLLTTPSELARWTGLKIAKGPDRQLATGDQIIFHAGLGRLAEIRFQVIDLEPSSRLALEVYLPFGIVNREVMVITSLPDSACRITFN